MDHDDAAMLVVMIAGDLLERVAQLLFDQQVVATYHDRSTTSEISVEEKINN